MKAPFERKLLHVRRLRRIELLCDLLAGSLLAAGVAWGLWLVVRRVLGLTWDTGWLPWALAAGAAVAAGALYLRRRPGLMDAALLVDAELGLRERFSSALAFRGREDDFARAATAEARRTAERIDVRRRFRVRPRPRWAGAPLAWGVAVAVLLFMPSIDLLGYLQRDRDRKERADRLEQTREDVRSAVQSVEAAVKELPDPQLAAELSKLTDPETPATDLKPEEVRREAIRKLDDLSRDLEKLLSDDKARTMESLKNMLRDLRTSEKGLDRELNRALARGDFDRASEILSDMQRRLADGELSDGERAALSEQMRDLSEQLDRAADGRVAEKLAGMGLEDSLAALDEDALREALEKRGLTPEQVEKVLNEVKACRSACAACRKLGVMAGACCGGGTDESLSPGEVAALAAELGALAAARGDVDAAAAALAAAAEAKATLGGADRSAAQISGAGLGRGAGLGSAPPSRDDKPLHAAARKTSDAVSASEGPVIAEWVFRGPQVAGEATRQRGDVIKAARSAAAEAVKEDRIPRRYEASVKKYFGTLDEVDDRE